jgi:Domain of unknown function (DUF5668)
MADANRVQCACAYCRIRGLMGPLILITVGILFLIGQYSRYSFGDLWPVLLIVIGVILVLQSLASKEGHISS